MATYNGRRYIREQLESILSQLPAESEVIVADDGSSDDTLDIIRAMDDSRITILPSEKHLGPVYNFERSLKATSGDVILLSDQDDVWYPGKVDTVLSALSMENGLLSGRKPLLVVHDAKIIDREGFSVGDSMWASRPYKSGLFHNWLKNSFTGCCLAFRRELLNDALPFPKNLPMHDQWLGMVAEYKKGVVALPEKLIGYRVHENNATNLFDGGKMGSFSKWIWRFFWRLSLLKSLGALR